MELLKLSYKTTDFNTNNAWGFGGWSGKAYHFAFGDNTMTIQIGKASTRHRGTFAADPETALSIQGTPVFIFAGASVLHADGVCLVLHTPEDGDPAVYAVLAKEGMPIGKIILSEYGGLAHREGSHNPSAWPSSCRITQYCTWEEMGGMTLPPEYVEVRLKALREELQAERISTGELLELQSLARFIEPGDVELLEAAGVPEYPES